MKEEWHGDDEQEAGMMPIHQDLERLPGGIIIYRVSESYEILYANRKPQRSGVAPVERN